MKVLSFIKNKNFYDVYFNDNESTEITIKNKCTHKSIVLDDWKTPYFPLIYFMVDGTKDLHILYRDKCIVDGLIEELYNGDYSQDIKELIIDKGELI